MIRPKTCTLLGVVFTFLGLGALISIGAAALNGVVSVNFLVLLLPVGIGLLRDREGSRKMGAFVLAAAALGSLITAALIPSTRWVMTFRFNEHYATLYGGYLIATLLAASVLIFCLYIAITMPHVVQFYRSRSRRTESAT